MLLSDALRIQKSGALDFPLGGVIGTAPNTVDKFAAFSVAQTTAGQTLSLPSPTITGDDYLAIVANVGTVAFTIHGSLVNAQQVALLTWDGTGWRESANPAPSDFWRSGIGAVDLPNGTTDLTDTIRRNGKVGINADSLIDLFVNGAVGFGINQTDIPNQVANVVLPINPADSSLYFWGQTTAGTKQTLPAPTNTYPQSQVLCLINSGSALAVIDLSAFGIPDATIKPGRAGLFFSGGLGWFPVDFVDAVSTKKIIVTMPLVAGDNVVTHNLNLLAPFVSTVEVRTSDTGAVISAHVVPTTRTATTLTINVGAAVPSADIIIVG